MITFAITLDFAVAATLILDVAFTFASALVFASPLTFALTCSLLRIRHHLHFALALTIISYVDLAIIFPRGIALILAIILVFILTIIFDLACAFAPDGKICAAGNSDGSVKVRFSCSAAGHLFYHQDVG